MRERLQSPVAAGLAIAVAFVLAALLVVGSIAGSYALTIHFYDEQQSLARKESVPVCKALKELAAVRGQHTSLKNSYGVNLQHALGRVYSATQCDALLKAEGAK